MGSIACTTAFWALALFHNQYQPLGQAGRAALAGLLGIAAVSSAIAALTGSRWWLLVLLPVAYSVLVLGLAGT